MKDKIQLTQSESLNLDMNDIQSEVEKMRKQNFN